MADSLSSSTLSTNAPNNFEDEDSASKSQTSGNLVFSYSSKSTIY